MAQPLPDHDTFVPAIRPPAEPSFATPTATMLALTLLSAVVIGGAAAISPLFGVVGVLGIAATLALAQRPQLSIYLMVTVAPASAGLHRGLLIPGFRISEVTIVGLATLVLLFAPRTQTLTWTRVEKLLLLYAVSTVTLGGLDLATRHAPLNATELGTLLGPFQFMLMLRAITVALTEDRHRIRAAHCLLAAATVVGVVSLAQFGNVGPTRSVLSTLTASDLYSTSLNEGAGRVTGPFTIWHDLAGFLMPSVLLSYALFLCSRSWRARLPYGTVLVITGAALLSTATAGPTIATVLGCLYISWKRRVLHVVLAAAIPVALVVAIAFGSVFSGRAEHQLSHSSSTYQLPFVPQTISYRYGVFEEQSAPALKGRWTTGYGPDLPPQLALGNFAYTESAYVSILLRGGVLLLAVFLLLLLAVARMAKKAQNAARDDFQWSIATVVFAMSISYLFLQLIETYLLDSGPPDAYWAFVGILLSVVARSDPKTGNSLPEP
jgi:hypothetical protein